MSSDFMTQRHEAFSTPEGRVFDLVQKSTKRTPVSRTKIVEGFDNEVYRIETKEDENFIVRIHRFGEVKPSQEVWAMEQSRQAGAPVPEVFFVGAVDLPTGQQEAMVLSEVEGKPLADTMKTLSTKQINQALINAGRVLRKIHSVKAHGFYQRHTDGAWDFPSWERFTASIDDRAKERDLILPAGFSNEDFDFMLRMLKYNAKEFPCNQPILNHGDYLPEHIFVADNLEVTGVIDFGMFQGGPPIHDFAQISFQAPSLNLEALIQGYGNHEMFNDRFDLRLNLQRLPLQMGHLAHETKQGNTEEVAFLSAGLKETVQFLKSNGSS